MDTWKFWNSVTAIASCKCCQLGGEVGYTNENHLGSFGCKGTEACNLSWVYFAFVQ